ncbi:MAG: hypothetical protein KA369_00665 [Spirochaetes bacterium]|nr:hypothetical protein [Spirochaetota bacterium]
MRQSGDTYHAGAYLSGKVRSADEKRDKLLDIINRLAELSYDKGTRAGDVVIRKYLSEMTGEVEQYYRMTRAFASAKGGETYAYQEILVFFNESYLEKYRLSVMIDALRKEMADQEKKNQEENPKYASTGHSRKVNTHAMRLEEDLRIWEKTFFYSAEPLLRAFLNEVNDIYLFHRINSIMGGLISRDNTFETSGEAFMNFKASLGYCLEMNIKINRKPMAAKEIVNLVMEMLHQMGLKGIITHSRNMTPEKFSIIIDGIISDWSLKELSRQYTGTSKGALDAIRSMEKDRAGKAQEKTQDIVSILEDLCYMGDPLEKPIHHPAVSPVDLVMEERDRYLFHSPGTFNISLKFVSEYARNSLILVFDFLNKEFQKGLPSFRLLDPMMVMVPAVRQFVKLYASALDISEHPKNKTTDRKGSQQFISRQLARDLIESVKITSAAVRSALVDTSYKVVNSPLDKSGVLGKKLEILKEAWSETHVKISKGLSDMSRA